MISSMSICNGVNIREWVREKVSERKKRNRNRQATKIAMSDLTKLRQDEWLEADGLGGFASNHVRHSNAPLPCAVVSSDQAARGPFGPRQRLRRLGGNGCRHICAFLSALSAGCHATRRRAAH